MRLKQYQSLGGTKMDEKDNVCVCGIKLWMHVQKGGRTPLLLTKQAILQLIIITIYCTGNEPLNLFYGKTSTCIFMAKCQFMMIYGAYS